MSPARTRLPLALAALVAALAIGAGVGAATYAVLDDGGAVTTVVQETQGETSRPASTSGLTIGEIYNRANRSVVEISAGRSGSFGGGRAQSQGSGFVFDKQGHIVTNQHVVSGADSLTVRLWNGSKYTASIVGTDPSTDLAVLKVGAPETALHPLQLGDSDDVRVGDAVVALGSPFGLEGTITSGIVSALNREMRAPNNFTISDSIQTDAAINHGNSGGPLLDGAGRVIGVNAQIESESGGSDGVGFAIPSNTVRSIVGQIVASGEATHAYLGISMVNVPEGVAVTDVRSDTPAAKAGLREATGTRTVNGQEIPSGGDVIVEFDGKQIASSTELQSAVDARRPGDTVEMTVLRDGKRVTVEITLGTRPPRIEG